MGKTKMNKYGIVKMILTVFGFAGILVFLVGAIMCIGMMIRQNPDQKKRDKYAKIDIDSFSKFEVTSTNLNDGKWDAVITNTAQGKNESPQLQWQAVAGAASYAIVMIDPDGSNWLHWKAITDKTSLEQGAYTGGTNEYIGPYPPSGTHRYTIYVFALKGTPFAVDEKLDSDGADIEKIAKELNSSQMSEYNNILAVGIIEGTYSKVD
jgi:phosphatidylethanolamine-binding protein (PEBP) family uncharacterized protein